MIEGLLTPCPMSYEDVRTLLPLSRRTIDELMEDYEKIPELQEMVSLEAARLSLRYNSAANHLDEVEATAYLRCNSMVGPDGKKFTVDAIKASVTVDPAVVEAKKTLIEAQALYEAWKGLVTAFRTKKDAATDACAFVRGGMLSRTRSSAD